MKIWENEELLNVYIWLSKGRVRPVGLQCCFFLRTIVANRSTENIDSTMLDLLLLTCLLSGIHSSSHERCISGSSTHNFCWSFSLTKTLSQKSRRLLIIRWQNRIRNVELWRFAILSNMEASIMKINACFTVITLFAVYDDYLDFQQKTF